jgi:hypothetical protein
MLSIRKNKGKSAIQSVNQNQKKNNLTQRIYKLKTMFQKKINKLYSKYRVMNIELGVFCKREKKGYPRPIMCRF